MTYKKWTEKDKEYIINNKEVKSNKELAVYLNVTESSLGSFLKNHKIKRDKIKRSRNHIDISGQIFDRLKVIEYSHTDKKFQSWWKCLCKCGGYKIANGNSLKTKETTSCGCKRRENEYNTIVNIAYKGHLNGAKSRNIVSYLSKNEYLNIAKNPCVYCGSISLRKSPCNERKFELNSVDRKNNEPYYKLENCQSVCFKCQHAKKDMKHLEFLEWLNLVFNFMKIKDN